MSNAAVATPGRPTASRRLSAGGWQAGAKLSRVVAWLREWGVLTTLLAGFFAVATTIFLAGRGVGNLESNVNALGQRIDQLDGRIGAVEVTGQQLLQRMSGVEASLDGVETRLGGIEGQLNILIERLVR